MFSAQGSLVFKDDWQIGKASFALVGTVLQLENAVVGEHQSHKVWSPHMTKGAPTSSYTKTWRISHMTLASLWTLWRTPSSNFLI